jgi:hypothetical protein
MCQGRDGKIAVRSGGMGMGVCRESLGMGQARAAGVGTIRYTTGHYGQRHAACAR